jgi:cephalosporin hydroxylase
MNGHPTAPDYGPGPYEAVEAFLDETGDFVPDRSRERLMMTNNPMGFLKRVR